MTQDTNGSVARMRVGALLVVAIGLGALAGACGNRDEAETDTDAETKRAWQQPASPAQAEQLRERLIIGQSDH